MLSFDVESVVEEENDIKTITYFRLSGTLRVMVYLQIVNERGKLLQLFVLWSWGSHLAL